VIVDSVELQLPVTDSDGGTGQDSVVITVTPQPDDAEDAGADGGPDGAATPPGAAPRRSPGTARSSMKSLAIARGPSIHAAGPAAASFWSAAFDRVRGATLPT
jgi:hypothetical protein